MTAATKHTCEVLGLCQGRGCKGCPGPAASSARHPFAPGVIDAYGPPSRHQRRVERAARMVLWVAGAAVVCAALGFLAGLVAGAL